MRQEIRRGMIALGLAWLMALSFGCGGSSLPVDEAAPRLGLMVNQLSEVETFSGWPMLVELRVRHPKLYRPSAEVEPMIISSPGETWADAVSLSVRTAEGGAVEAPLRLMPPEKGALTLDDRATGHLAWWLTGEDAAKLAEGDYALTAVLDTRDVQEPGAWRGRAESAAVAFHLGKEPSPLTEGQAEEKLLLLAACAQALGEGDKARARVEALLASRPESIEGLALKAEQLEAAGDKAGALKTYEKALAVFRRDHPDAEPAGELWRNHRRLLRELLKKKE